MTLNSRPAQFVKGKGLEDKLKITADCKGIAGVLISYLVSREVVLSQKLVALRLVGIQQCTF